MPDLALPSPLRCEELTGTDRVREVYPFRYQVWAEEATPTEAVHQSKMIYDEHDDHARHWGIFSGQDLVASARLCIHESQADVPDHHYYEELSLPAPVASINRLVVARCARRTGIARFLDSTRIKAAGSAGAACLVASAASCRVRALQSAGFTLYPYQYKSWYLEEVWWSVMVRYF